MEEQISEAEVVQLKNWCDFGSVPRLIKAYYAQREELYSMHELVATLTDTGDYRVALKNVKYLLGVHMEQRAQISHLHSDLKDRLTQIRLLQDQLLRSKGLLIEKDRTIHFDLKQQLREQSDEVSAQMKDQPLSESEATKIAERFEEKEPRDLDEELEEAQHYQPVPPRKMQDEREESEFNSEFEEELWGEIDALKAQIAALTVNVIFVERSFLMKTLSEDSTCDRDSLQSHDSQLAVLVAEIRGIAEESILPDGDGVTTPVALWAESVLERFGWMTAGYEQQIRNKALEEAEKFVSTYIRITGRSENL